jgi:hypothetical protein
MIAKIVPYLQWNASPGSICPNLSPVHKNIHLDRYGCYFSPLSVKGYRKVYRNPSSEEFGIGSGK